MKVPLRVRTRRPFWRLLAAARFIRCKHDFESHVSADERGTVIYLCRKCPAGWKVT